MTNLGVELSVTELVDIMSNLDQNGDGVMDFDEFLIMMEPRKMHLVMIWMIEMRF